jgi:hypothetical protein
VALKATYGWYCDPLLQSWVRAVVAA